MRVSGVAFAGIALAGALCGSGASAAITGIEISAVPNAVWASTGAAPGSDPVAGAAWASRPWQTFDLTLRGSHGDVVLGVHAGTFSAGSGAVYFNHSVGSDLRSFALEPIFPAIGFDTYVTLGGNDTQNGAPITLLAGTDLTGPGGVLTFGFDALAPAQVGANGQLRVLRFSVADFASNWFGQLSVVTPSGVQTFQVVPPSPGAGAVAFVAAGFMGARRRR